MKCSRTSIHRKTHAYPTLRFEEQQLTSFSGLILIHQLFDRLGVKARLRQCFRPLGGRPIFGLPSVVVVLIVHLMLGYRELRHLAYYRDDPMVKRLLGVSRLPDVSTISRTLAGAVSEQVARFRALLGEFVLQRLCALGLSRVTLDFDGSVLGTTRQAEGTAVGFNRRKKGQRSYYPLFCTVAQSGQVLDVLHRSGNVHDSNGADAFILHCIGRVREAMPWARIEVRMDAAFFSEQLIDMLEASKVEYTISVPFARLTELKEYIEARRRWRRVDDDSGYFERRWKAKSWSQRRRFMFVRSKARKQHKGPLQLELFTPYEYGYDFKVIVTNKRLGARKLIQFHNGRGSQEGIFGELKSGNQMDYVPVRTWVGNQIYLLSAVLAHNLARELHMIAHPPSRATLEKRPALWDFTQLDTLRRRLIQRAGRLIRPQGQLTLSMSANRELRDQLLHYLDAPGAPA